MIAFARSNLTKQTHIHVTHTHTRNTHAINNRDILNFDKRRARSRVYSSGARPGTAVQPSLLHSRNRNIPETGRTDMQDIKGEQHTITHVISMTSPPLQEKEPLWRLEKSNGLRRPRWTLLQLCLRGWRLQRQNKGRSGPTRGRRELPRKEQHLPARHICSRVITCSGPAPARWPMAGLDLSCLEFRHRDRLRR